ncbi:hypothetical protein ACEUCJ_19655, partial [Aeromonas rivipollensis]|uniref:hypothetical protein n=3 Tax=Aeromonas rivipollensis TaxID=948519 RepID=UPI0038D1005D
DATVRCCGSGILLNRLLESSLIFKGFSRLSTGLFALPLALSMEAHYRELKLSGKPIFAKSGNKSSKIGLSLVIHSQPQLLYKLIHRNEPGIARMARKLRRPRWTCD